jgi:phosphohistidine phosphatase SixA
LSTSENLLVGSAPSAIAGELKGAKGVGVVLVVGHQPHLGECVSFLTGKSPEEMSIKKGGYVLVETNDLKEGKGKLLGVTKPPKLEKESYK